MFSVYFNILYVLRNCVNTCILLDVGWNEVTYPFCAYFGDIQLHQREGELGAKLSEKYNTIKITYESGLNKSS